MQFRLFFVLLPFFSFLLLLSFWLFPSFFPIFLLYFSFFYQLCNTNRQMNDVSLLLGLSTTINHHLDCFLFTDRRHRVKESRVRTRRRSDSGGFTIIIMICTHTRGGDSRLSKLGMNLSKKIIINKDEKNKQKKVSKRKRIERMFCSWMIFVGVCHTNNGAFLCSGVEADAILSIDFLIVSLSEAGNASKPEKQVKHLNPTTPTNKPKHQKEWSSG